MKRPRPEQGAAAVEFGLVMPFLMLILFGTVTVGLTYSDHLAITNAVREGSRFGAGVDYTQPGWATSVRDRVKDVYFNEGSRITDEQICVALTSSTGASLASWTGSECGSEPDAPTSMVAGSCVSKVWVRKPAHVVLVVTSPLTFDIGASSVAYYGRTLGSCSAE